MSESDGAKLEMMTVGGGCFWCTEAVMLRIEGVAEVISGYMGGHVDSPTYEQICTARTGHAEVIQIKFDSEVISYSELLDIFWQAHDPTTLNQQGNDRGPQYRSVIFTHSDEQAEFAEKSKVELDQSGAYNAPSVTEITPAMTFWPAEDYHQDYYRRNRELNSYCQIVISPKMRKLGLEP